MLNKLPPGPKIPFWLIALQLNADPFGFMDAIYKRYGDIITIMFGSTPTVYISNPLGIKEIFTNTKENSIKQSISNCNGIQSDKIQIKLVISAICTTHSKSIDKTCTIEDVQMKLSLK